MNIRAALQNGRSGEVFSKQLLNIGNGKIPVESLSGYFKLPANFCHFTESKTELIEMVFPNIAQNYNNHVWLSERVILAPKNVDIKKINFQTQNKIAGEFDKSVDSVTNQNDVVNYPTEFFNSLELFGLISHNFQLKVVSVIIIL